MRIDPETAVLEALRNQNLDWKSVIGELIDNSLDADAAHIEIFHANRQLRVVDNGIGSSQLDSMLKLGGRKQHSTTKLGRYGIGLKDAALWLWGTTTIATVHKGVLRVAKVNWEKLSKQGKWEIDDPEEYPLARCGDYGLNEEKGTCILFTDFDKRLNDWDGLVDQLSFIFHPAIKYGKNIIFRKGKGRETEKVRIAQPYSWPPMIESVNRSIEVDGKTARVFAGIIEENTPNPHSGLTYLHGHRVLLQTDKGCGEYSTGQFCGYVELDGAWKITKNKNDLSAQQEELYEAVLEVVKPLLEKARKQSISMATTNLILDLEESLNSAVVQDAKEKRNKVRNAEGTIKPSDTGRTRIRATLIKPGKKKLWQKAISSRLRIDFVNLGDESPGMFDLNAARVKLNIANPAVLRARDSGDRNWLLTMALVLVSAKKVFFTNDMQRYFPFATDAKGEEQFLDCLGYALSEISKSVEANEQIQVA